MAFFNRAAKFDKNAGQPVTFRTTRDLVNAGGIQTTLPDSGSGRVWRPRLTGPYGEEYGERKAVLETMFAYYNDNVRDPDYALAQDPNADELLMSHQGVRPCFLKRSLSVARLNRQVLPSRAVDSDRDECQKMADHCEDVFEQIPNMRHLYQQMENAFMMGGQGHEWIWAKDAIGTWRPKYFYPVHKSWFVRDRIGNMGILTRETPVWGSYVGVQPMMQGDMKVAGLLPGKFMYHVYTYEAGPWYRPESNGFMYWGRGEDIPLFRVVMFDNFVMRYRMKWLEKHGMPLTILKYEGAMSQASQDMYNSVVRSLRGESVVGMNKNFDIEMMEPPRIGYDAFANFYDQWTLPSIQNILLGGSNTMQLGSRGSYSATMEQNDTGLEVFIEWDAMTIDATLNSQLIGPIVRAVPKWRNVPDHHLPKHVITPERRRNRLMELEILERMSSMVPVRRHDVYDAGGKQPPRDKEDVVAPVLGQSVLSEKDGASGAGVRYPNPQSEKEPPKSPGFKDRTAQNMFESIRQWDAEGEN